MLHARIFKLSKPPTAVMWARAATVAMVMVVAVAGAPPDGPPGQTTAYDVTAVLVPVTQVNELSALIAQHKVVRLEVRAELATNL